MGEFFAFSWVLSGEVAVVENGLLEPGVVVAFDCIWKLLCEDFIGCHIATDRREV